MRHPMVKMVRVQNKYMSENGYLFRPTYVTWAHD